MHIHIHISLSLYIYIYIYTCIEKELKPMCIDSGMSYAKRVEKREEEMAALKQAYAYIYIYIYISLSIYIYIYIYMHTHICIYVCTYLSFLYIYIYTYIMCICVCIYIYIYTHIHIYIYIHIMSCTLLYVVYTFLYITFVCSLFFRPCASWTPTTSRPSALRPLARLSRSSARTQRSCARRRCDQKSLGRPVYSFLAIFYVMCYLTFCITG